MDDRPTTEELERRYAAAMHGVQSGIAIGMELGLDDSATPKHLRVGVNSALIDCGALAELLERKGVFTREEFLETLVAAAERERAKYEQELTTAMGRPVKLG